MEKNTAMGDVDRNRLSDLYNRLAYDRNCKIELQPITEVYQKGIWKSRSRERDNSMTDKDELMLLSRVCMITYEHVASRYRSHVNDVVYTQAAVSVLQVLLVG
ncbi:uncharacterized [Tachysurus ichikawai]